MKEKSSKFLNVIKWLSLAFAICFSLVSCAESLLPSQKTSDQVDGLIDDDFINTADYVALKDFDVEIKKPNENNIYYVGQKINYDVNYSPSNASYKTLSFEINNEDLVSINEKSHQIECLKSGFVEINFQVLKEEKVGTRTLSFEIRKLEFNKFNIIDEAGNIYNNKDIIFKNVTDKPRLFKIDTDSKIARDLLLQISVGDNKIASVTKDGEYLKVTPVSEGRTTATLKIEDLEIKLYISTIELNLKNVKLKASGGIEITHGLDYIFNTLYFTCDDVRAVDHERLVCEFEEDSFFELADYRSGIIIGRNEFFLNIRYKESKYDEVSAMPEGSIIQEKVKVSYVYPGGTTVRIKQDNQGIEREYFTLTATTIPKLKLDNYSYIPDEINFGYLINDKGELYHQDYFQNLITKTSYNGHSIKKYDYYYPKFEVIEGNPDDLNLAKSTFYRLVIDLNEGVTPAPTYKIRYYFNEFNKAEYKDITINFRKITELPKTDVIVDFRNVYGVLDKTKSGIIPENYTYSGALNDGQLGHYEFVDENGEIIPAFKGGGIILDDNSYDKESYLKYQVFSNLSETGENVAHKKSFYNRDYCYEIALKNRVKLYKGTFNLRFTSPVFDFFGVERQWTEVKINIDDSPEHIQYKVNDKKARLIASNQPSPVYEYPEELNVGERLKITCDGQDSEFPAISEIKGNAHDYKYTKETVYDGKTFTNFKNIKENSINVPSSFASMYPLSYKASDPDVGNFSEINLVLKYPGECVFTFNNGIDYGDHYEFEFKLKVKVKGERSPIDVHETKLENFKELDYSKNDLKNGNIRVGSSITIDKSMFDSKLFNENVDISVSNPSLLKLNKEDNSLTALRTGKVTIYVRLKKYNHVVETFDLNITNSTAPFSLLKSDFIDLKENEGVQSLVGHVDKEYNIKIKPVVASSSKYIKVEEISDDPILDINSSGIIKTNNGGKTKLRVTYGNGDIGEQEFSQIYDFEVIDNSVEYNGFVYFTRKFVGHFGLNAAIAVCTTVFFIMLFHDKKKLNYVIAPASIAYGGFMACFSELLQNLVPSRYCATSDMWINFQGTLFGFLLTIIIYCIVVLVIYLINKNKQNKLKTAQNSTKNID